MLPLLLLAFVERILPEIVSAVGNTQFNPTVDNKTVFGDYPDRASSGQFMRLPILTGSADYEAGIIKVIYGQFGIKWPLSQWASLILSTYQCPLSDIAARKATHVPIWRYRYFGEFPNTRLTLNPSSGAWHGSWLGIIFGTAAGSGEPNTDAENGLIDLIQGAWAAFAKDPAQGLEVSRFQWPLYDPNTAIALEEDAFFLDKIDPEEPLPESKLSNSATVYSTPDKAAEEEVDTALKLASNPRGRPRKNTAGSSAPTPEIEEDKAEATKRAKANLNNYIKTTKRRISLPRRSDKDKEEEDEQLSASVRDRKRKPSRDTALELEVKKTKTTTRRTGGKKLGSKDPARDTTGDPAFLVKGKRKLSTPLLLEYIRRV
ncbi:hypothetical protein MRB53_036928 [Persea americana]|nr:hypothetical protein MRB53_036928 [Persea americana]